MEPRRTFRETSRTAKNPANSLVNPWVSRMNSSAKQTSPISHRREVHSRVADYSFHRLVLPDVLERLRTGRLRGRNMPSSEPVRQGGKTARFPPPDAFAISRIPAAGPQRLRRDVSPGSGRRKAFFKGVWLQ